MKINLTKINFYGQPNNYAVIDKYVSRSAQPQKEDFTWLKKQGVTDIINFRTMRAPDINFDEKEEVEKIGIRYHNIPSITTEPKKENIDKFLNLIEKIKANGGKAHIHCKAGADRTGMYTFIYKMINGLGSLSKNQAEWFEHGYHYLRYPNLMEWTKNFVLKTKK